jgi:hypothetical protein
MITADEVTPIWMGLTVAALAIGYALGSVAEKRNQLKSRFYKPQEQWVDQFRIGEPHLTERDSVIIDDVLGANMRYKRAKNGIFISCSIEEFKREFVRLK